MKNTLYLLNSFFYDLFIFLIMYVLLCPVAHHGQRHLMIFRYSYRQREMSQYSMTKEFVYPVAMLKLDVGASTCNPSDNEVNAWRIPQDSFRSVSAMYEHAHMKSQVQYRLGIVGVFIINRVMIQKHLRNGMSLRSWDLELT